MASLYCNNNQARDSCFSKSYHGRRSCSKAQASLSKILHLISTIPPPLENDPNPFKKRGFDIDLNLRLGSFLDDDEEEKSESLAENSFLGKNTDGQEEETEEIQQIQQKTATDASSEVTEMQKSDELKSGTDGEVKTTALDMLIEAAELISEMDHKEDEIENLDEFINNDDDNDDDDDDDDDVSPVVRSKRGRYQVLPRRFRDSVLEPWKKRPQKSTAVMVSSKKRRSR